MFARAPLLARGGANIARACPLRLGQPRVSSRSQGPGGAVCRAPVFAGRPVGSRGEVMARRDPPMPRGCVGAGRRAGIHSPRRSRTAGGCGDARHAGYVLGEERCGGGTQWPEGVRSWPFEATRSAATLLAAGFARGCAQRRGSQPWAGGVSGHGLSRWVPHPPMPGWDRGEVGGARGVTN